MASQNLADKMMIGQVGATASGDEARKLQSCHGYSQANEYWHGYRSFQCLRARYQGNRLEHGIHVGHANDHYATGTMDAMDGSREGFDHIIMNPDLVYEALGSDSANDAYDLLTTQFS
ncbi:MAG: hypothetical protein MMC23_008343 [Stictis urceolatum]|nr:hypothetical protein [Stictis urceolata]